MKYLLPSYDEPFSQGYSLGPIRLRILIISKCLFVASLLCFTVFFSYSEIKIDHDFLAHCLFEIFFRDPDFLRVAYAKHAIAN